MAVREGVADATRRGGQRSRSSRSSFDFAPPSKRRRSTPRRLQRRYARDDRLGAPRRGEVAFAATAAPRRPHLAEREQLLLGEQQRPRRIVTRIRRLRGRRNRGAPAVEEAAAALCGASRAPPPTRATTREAARCAGFRAVAPRPAASTARTAAQAIAYGLPSGSRRGDGRRPAPSSSSPPRPRARGRRASAVIREQGGDVGRRDEPLGRSAPTGSPPAQPRAPLGAGRAARERARRAGREPAEVVLRRDRGGVLDGAAAPDVSAYRADPPRS